MSGPRIGILTFHRCINYGSYWQARCLADGLRRRGYDAVLLDHRSRQVDLAEWRCALRPVTTARRDRRYVAKTRRFFEAFRRLPLSPPFDMERGLDGGRYDLVLVGSDEVWNLRHPWFGGVRLFYGEGAGGARLASYAASFGNHSEGDGLDGFWRERLARFDSISVRDANSFHLIEGALGRQPELVLDPCLQFSEEIEVDLDAGERGPYIAVYGHSFPAWFRRAITTWARAEGKRLVSIGYRNDWSDENRIAAGPEEFASLMAGAEAVVTGFFHGCVFALAFDRPFVCVGSDYRQNKLRDLTDAVGAPERLVTPATPAQTYGELLTQTPGPAVSAALGRLRRQSSAYLHAVLG